LACLRSYSADLVEALRGAAVEFGFLLVSAAAQ
jgi:hypothetical protein